MFEELVWVDFLATLPRVEAGNILLNLVKVNLRDAFQAQENYEGVPNLPFPEEWVAETLSSGQSAQLCLRSIFEKHGFVFKGKNQYQPNLLQLAKKVGMEADYRLVYHATSKAVHFNPHELMRRVWGDTKMMHISSQHFNAYWASFALERGSRLYGTTLIDVITLLGTSDILKPEVEAMLDAIRLVKRDGAIPIITLEEVAWFDEGDAAKLSSSKRAKA